MKSHIVVVKDKMPTDGEGGRLPGYYFVILPNSAAGKPNRYDIYRIPSGSGRIKVVGQELTLGFAKRHAKSLAAKLAG